MTIKIKNRWNGNVVYSSETAVNLTEAVIEAVKSGANLRGANLRDAYLRGANLRDAYLGGAYLGGANLGGANLGENKYISTRIQGSMDHCQWHRPFVLGIGCEVHSIDTWLREFEAIGERHGYTEQQIREYKTYIDLYAAQAWDWLSNLIFT